MIHLVLNSGRQQHIQKHAVLGPLAEDTESAQRLVETLDALYDEALSLNRAAKCLHVHANTVAYRIRRALELTGETDVGSPGYEPPSPSPR